MSARAIQWLPPMVMGKTFDTSPPMGPAIVSADEINDRTI